MTVRNLIQLFRHFGEDSTGYTPDDTRLSDLAIWEQIVKSRATMIKNLLKTKHVFGDVMFQTIPCVMFEEVEANECDLIPPSGCKILKSTCEIPNFLHLSGVSSQLGNKSFDIVRWDQLEGKLNSRIESIRKDAYVSIRNINGKQYMYILNDSYIENLVITGIAEDPVIFAQFCGDVNANCDPLSLQVHTDAEIQDAILKMAWDSIIRLRQNAVPDIQNNDMQLG
jgi:hypothetical protein